MKSSLPTSKPPDQNKTSPVISDAVLKVILSLFSRSRKGKTGIIRKNGIQAIIRIIPSLNCQFFFIWQNYIIIRNRLLIQNWNASLVFWGSIAVFPFYLILRYSFGICLILTCFAAWYFSPASLVAGWSAHQQKDALQQ